MASAGATWPRGSSASACWSRPAVRSAPMTTCAWPCAGRTRRAGCCWRSDGRCRKKARRKTMSELIHTCYRIGEIDRSVAFYEALGMKEMGRLPIRDEAVNVYMGFEEDGPRLELTYNFGVDSYDLGTGYNHIAVTVDNLDEVLPALAERG